MSSTSSIALSIFAEDVITDDNTDGHVAACLSLVTIPRIEVALMLTLSAS